jgi:hypothetical protein
VDAAAFMGIQGYRPGALTPIATQVSYRLGLRVKVIPKGLVS